MFPHLQNNTPKKGWDWNFPIASLVQVIHLNLKIHDVMIVLYDVAIFLQVSKLLNMPIFGWSRN